MGCLFYDSWDSLHVRQVSGSFIADCYELTITSSTTAACCHLEQYTSVLFSLILGSEATLAPHLLCFSGLHLQKCLAASPRLAACVLPCGHLSVDRRIRVDCVSPAQLLAPSSLPGSSR